MQDGVNAIGDSLFINTTYSFNTAVNSTYKYAQDLILRDSGKIDEKIIQIKSQTPVAPALEVAFPELVFERTIPIFDKTAWKLKGSWKPYEIKSGDKLEKQSMYAEKPGDELEFAFTGTGISLEGNWYKNGGKADVYVDGQLHRKIDTYYDFANQEHTVSIWHAINLKPGDHTIRLIVKGEKRPEASGTRVYITSATIFQTGLKKNETFKFSFEK
jgi:hypothetical protein